MRTIAVMNQKGGCGKTTIAINLCGALRHLDRRVLLLDMDPQAHATMGIGVRDRDLDVTTFEVLSDAGTLIGDAALTLDDGFALVPASTALSGVEQLLAGADGRERRLADKLARLGAGAFDVAVIDCPPSVGLLTFNALLAAEEVVIPVDASYFSLQGLVKLRETLEVIEERTGHQLRVHVVCNNIDTRTHFSQDLLDEVEKFHAGVLVDTYISNSVRLKEAAATGKTIFELARTSRPAGQFLSLARELLERESRVRVDDIESWMEKLHGPTRVPEGILFVLDAPQAGAVSVTGEFVNWSRDGVPLRRDPDDGLWKGVVDVAPGEYEYRFVVDGVWIRDPNNKDYVRNEFGQENSLLIV